MFINLFTYCKIIFIGMLMGIANIIPGVSGGTIAVVTGVYDNLIESISQFLTAPFEDKKKYSIFLLQIIFGAGISIILLSKVIDNAFKHYNYQILFFFIGLIIGSIPLLLKENKIILTISNYKKLLSLLWFIIGLVIPILLIFLPESNYDNNTMTYLSASGFIAAAAMILPGLSGSLMFLILGTYKPIITAINNLNFILIFNVAIGGVFGLITLSRLINYCIKNFVQYSYCFIIGLMIGSCINIWPGIPQANTLFLFVLLMISCLGIIVGMNLDKLK